MIRKSTDSNDPAADQPDSYNDPYRPRPLRIDTAATRAGEFGDPVVVAGKGVVIFRVVSKTDFDPAAFAAQRRKLEDAARQQEAQRLIEAEISRRRPQEKIIVNEDALKRYIQG